MHQHWITEGFFTGAGAKIAFDIVAKSAPPYTGNNYWIKWLYVIMHTVAVQWDNVHLPGSSADVAAAPPVKP